MEKKNTGSYRYDMKQWKDIFTSEQVPVIAPNTVYQKAFNGKMSQKNY
jgi:hypothetical protein